LAAGGVPGLIPAYDNIAFRERQSRAQLLSAAVALAAERFRRQQHRWPASLAELVPTYLNAVPTDPFDLQPLRFKKLTDGIVIYSVGDDGVDDGGQVLPRTRQPRPPDIGVRLWDVAHRRQPPPTDLGVPPG
jgi:hypothetical protein